MSTDSALVMAATTAGGTVGTRSWTGLYSPLATWNIVASTVAASKGRLPVTIS